MNTGTKVFVVDDDAAVRDSLAMLLEADGHEVETFENAEDFLAACAPGTLGCLILDLDMPGMDGLGLQEKLAQHDVRLPVIFLSGYGTVPVTVRAIKAGAMDFLTKPLDGDALLARVRDALRECLCTKEQNQASRSLASRLAMLSEREREVMMLVVAGHTSKEIAQHLGISYRTVEVHRAHVMQKTGASNLMELIRIVDEMAALNLVS